MLTETQIHTHTQTNKRMCPSVVCNITSYIIFLKLETPSSCISQTQVEHSFDTTGILLRPARNHELKTHSTTERPNIWMLMNLGKIIFCQQLFQTNFWNSQGFLRWSWCIKMLFVTHNCARNNMVHWGLRLEAITCKWTWKVKFYVIIQR